MVVEYDACRSMPLTIRCDCSTATSKDLSAIGRLQQHYHDVILPTPMRTQMKLVRDGVVVALMKLMRVNSVLAHRLVSGCLANLTTTRDVTWELLQANGHQVGIDAYEELLLTIVVNGTGVKTVTSYKAFDTTEILPSLVNSNRNRWFYHSRVTREFWNFGILRTWVEQPVLPTYSVGTRLKRVPLLWHGYVVCRVPMF